MTRGMTSEWQDDTDEGHDEWVTGRQWRGHDEWVTGRQWRGAWRVSDRTTVTGGMTSEWDLCWWLDNRRFSLTQRLQHEDPVVSPTGKWPLSLSPGSPGQCNVSPIIVKATVGSYALLVFVVSVTSVLPPLKRRSGLMHFWLSGQCNVSPITVKAMVGSYALHPREVSSSRGMSVLGCCGLHGAYTHHHSALSRCLSGDPHWLVAIHHYVG